MSAQSKPPSEQVGGDGQHLTPTPEVVTPARRHDRAGGPAMTPTYHSTTRINGHVVGEFMAPIPDPLARTTVTVGWRDILRSLLTRRTLVVEVCIGADSRTATRLLELDPDYLGPAGSPSRKAWDAALNERLGSL